MRSLSNHAPGDAGFTLFELLVVLAIVALGISVGAARWSGGGAASRNAEFGALRATLAEARGSALLRGLQVEITLGRAVRTASGNPELIFYPDGSSSGGTFRIGDGSETRVISIDRLTGHPVEVLP